MALTIFFDSVNNRTLAYVKPGVNRFEAVGQWTEEEVKMTLRLVRNFPVGSWNRAPGTLQFAIALAIARMLEQARLSIEEFGDSEIYRTLARGQLSVGRRVAEQPDFVSGVEIIHLDPSTGIGDTYELVFNVDAQTLAWQKQGDTSTNTISVRDGEFDILDDTGNLFVRVRMRVAELPGEDRTESFLIEDVQSADYLNRVAENYFDGRLSRATGESDTIYRQRILDFLEDIGNTVWGLQDRLARAVSYEPRIENTREWHEDFFVAGARVAESVDFTPADPEFGDVFSITINGTKFSYTTSIVGTVADVTAGLFAAINAGSEPVTATDVGPGTLVRVVSDVAGTSFTFSAATINLSTGVDNQTIAYTLGSGATPGSDISSVSAETTGEVEHVLKPSTKDTYLKEDEPATNKGTEAIITVGLGTIASSRHHAVLEFDLSAIPAGSTIKSATLEIYAKTKGASGDTRFINIHRVARILQNWTELGATWNNLNASFKPVREGFIATGTTVGVYKISTDLTAILQEWHDGIKSNFGFMLIDSDEDDGGNPNTVWDFASREGISAEQPILRVKRTTFTPGSPTTDSTLIAKAKGSIHTMFGGASSANYFLRARFKESSRQSVDFTPTLGSTGDRFIIAINSVNFFYAQQGGDGIPQVTAGLKAAIDAGDELVAVTDDGAKITVVQDVPGDAFTSAASVTGTAGLTANETQANIDDIKAGIDEMKPASRRVLADTGYGEEIASFEAQDAELPSSGGATLDVAGTDFKNKVLKFSTAGDERAYFQFEVPDDYNGEGINVVLHYRGLWSGTPTGRALFAVEERNVVDDDVWDAALVELREFKVRAPLDTLAQQHTDVRKEFAVLDPTWTARDIIQLALVRKKTDPIDDLADTILVHKVKLYKKT